jgi:hypothetical protein
MQDRYAGDLGDFSKCGLVRALGRAGLRIGVVWCHAPDQHHNADGRHIDYLRPTHRQANLLERCDRPLYRAFRQGLTDAQGRVVATKRNVDALVCMRIWPAGARHFTDKLDYERWPAAQRRRRRKAWLNRALEATAASEIVFFDPDNGLPVPSVRRHHRHGCKYVYFDELTPFWRRGQSLAIYQHTHRRGSAERQAAQRIDQLLRHLSGAALVTALRFRRGTSRLYLIAAQADHVNSIKRALDQMLDRPWSQHFELM